MLILTQHDHAFRVDFIKKSAKASIKDNIRIKQIWINIRTQITSYHHKTEKNLLCSSLFL